ncbi:MAG: hypothetical protein ACKVU4_12100 [Phycisphaerales bacterium]
MTCLLAQTPTPGAPTHQSLFGSAAQLWLILAIIGVLVLAVAGAVFHRHTMRMRELREHHDQRRRKPIADAWAEAGRRAQPLPREDDEDGPPDTDGER